MILGENPLLPLWGFAVRAVLILAVLLIMIRLMGKREIGQLSPFDFAVAVTLGSIAAGPISRGEASAITAALSIIVFSLLHIGTALASERLPAVERMVTGSPRILIESGRLVEDTMRRTLINTEELLSLLRLRGIDSISDVEVAILEPSGSLSVIPKSQAAPLTPRDAGIATQYRGLSTLLIDDGEVNDAALTRIGLERDWLTGELRRHGIDDPSQALVALIDTRGNFYAQKTDRRKQQKG